MVGSRKAKSKIKERAPVLEMASVEGGEPASESMAAGRLEQARQAAFLAAKAAVAVKAEAARVLDVHELVEYTDFLVVCTGRNTRLTRRIAEEVRLTLKAERQLTPVGSEGGQGGEWLLLDYLDFVVHIFTPEAREFYRLESLWKQAPVEEVS